MSNPEDTTRLMPDVHPAWAVPALADGDPTVTVRPAESGSLAESGSSTESTSAADTGTTADVSAGARTISHDPGVVFPSSGSGSQRSASQPASWTELSSSTTGRYTVGGELGAGGMGVVFSALQDSLGREVAVKVLRDANDPKLRAAFVDEARLAAALDHPGCVPIHDAGADFLVMRLVRGKTFSDWLSHHKPITEHLADAIEILIAVTDAVGHAHAHGIVHRDLKPGNILLGAGPGEVMVADWGLAMRIVDGQAQLGATGACAGTPSYLPPEAARGHTHLLGTASDVFLLGAILHRVLAGRPPWPGRAAEAVRAAAQGVRSALATLAPEAPAVLVALAEHALAVDPAARGDCAAFAAGLRGWLGHSTTDRAAAIALAEAESELAASETALVQPTARQPAETNPYANTAAAVAAAERCLTTWHGHPRALQVRDHALAAGTQRALRVGDLALAGLFVGRISDAGLSASTGATVAAATTARVQHQRTMRRWSAAGVIGITLAVVAMCATWTWQAQADRRDRARRQFEADALLAAVEIEPGRLPGQKAAAAYRALGLVPDSAAALAQATAATQQALTQALTADDRRLAQALLERQMRLSPALAKQLAEQLSVYDSHVHQRAADAMAHWQDDFQRIAGLESGGGKTGGGKTGGGNTSALKPAAVPHVAALLASWPSDNVQPVIAGLAASAVPEQRLVACAAAAIRPALINSTLLAPLLTDANSDVRRAAWRALACAHDVAVWPAMVSYLTSLPDPWDARLAAAELGPWGHQRLTPTSDQHLRWILGDHHGWLAALAMQAQPSAADLAEAARTAWYALGDAALADTWITRLETVAPHDPEAPLLRAEIDLDRGHPADAYARLQALPSDVPQRLPLLIHAAYRLQRSTELPTLGAQLNGVSAHTDWGHRRLLVRSALQMALKKNEFASDLGDLAKAAMAPAREAWLSGNCDLALAQARIGRMRWSGSSAVDHILAGSALASDSLAPGSSATGSRATGSSATGSVTTNNLAAEALAAIERIAIPLRGVPLIACLAQQRLGRSEIAMTNLASASIANAGSAGAAIIVAARREDRVPAVHQLLTARITLIQNNTLPDSLDPRLIQIRDLLERGLGGLAVRRMATFENPNATLQRDLLDQVLLGAPALHNQGWSWRPTKRVALDLLHEAALAMHHQQPLLAQRRLDAAAGACTNPFLRDLLAALHASLTKAVDAPTRLSRLPLDYFAEVAGESWVYDLTTGVTHDSLRLRPLPDLALDPESLRILRQLAATWRNTMRPAPGPHLLMPAAAAAARALIPNDPLENLTLPEVPPPPDWDTWLNTWAAAH